MARKRKNTLNLGMTGAVAGALVGGALGVLFARHTGKRVKRLFRGRKKLKA